MFLNVFSFHLCSANIPICVRCESPSTHKQGRLWLCPKHYRFGQIKAEAKRKGKTVPSNQCLEEMATLICGDCGVRMNWLARHNQTLVASFQHYRDGSYGIVCRSCNTRHAHMDGDTYRSMPKDHKKCPKCLQVKPLSKYAADNSKSGPMKIKSWCQSCSTISHREWKLRKKENN